MAQERLLAHSEGPSVYLLDFGRPLPNYRLLRSPCDCTWRHKKLVLGEWLLLRLLPRPEPAAQPHRARSSQLIIASWTATPTHSPPIGVGETAFWDFLWELEQWEKHPDMNTISEFGKQIKLSPLEGFLLVREAMSCGYSETNSGFNRWLFEYLGFWLMNAPQLKKID